LQIRRKAALKLPQPPDDMVATGEPHNTAARPFEQPVVSMTGSSWFLDHGPRGGTLFVPGEDVLLLAVDLPIASRRHRMEALPFAIEDRIAEPLDAVHVAIGAQLSPNRYLAAVVKHG
jgi:general secretion pathway protein L